MNTGFEEEHTALSDALIEMAIFVKCYSLHKKFTKNAHRADTEYKYKGFPKWDEERGNKRLTAGQRKIERTLRELQAAV